jgi:ABC-type bacteriocin/lantibiotic exporter with double-glycine peptidase domain
MHALSRLAAGQLAVCYVSTLMIDATFCFVCLVAVCVAAWTLTLPSAAAAVISTLLLCVRLYRIGATTRSMYCVVAHATSATPAALVSAHEALALEPPTAHNMARFYHED